MDDPQSAQSSLGPLIWTEQAAPNESPPTMRDFVCMVCLPWGRTYCTQVRGEKVGRLMPLVGIIAPRGHEIRRAMLALGWSHCPKGP